MLAILLYLHQLARPLIVWMSKLWMMRNSMVSLEPLILMMTALIGQDIELIRLFCPDRDLVVHEFSDLTHSHKAYVKGTDDELLEAPETRDNMEIQKGLLFKDFPTLRRWLQEYYVKRKIPFNVRHSYVERRYTIVCEKANCN
jgi:hypothetical protein